MLKAKQRIETAIQSLTTICCDDKINKDNSNKCQEITFCLFFITCCSMTCIVMYLLIMFISNRVTFKIHWLVFYCYYPLSAKRPYMVLFINQIILSMLVLFIFFISLILCIFYVGSSCYISMQCNHFRSASFSKRFL